MSTSTFPELLRNEQHVALVTVIVQRMSELTLLSEVCAARPIEDVAREIVGITDADQTRRRAMGKAIKSLVLKTSDAVTKAGSHVVDVVRKNGNGQTPSCPECGSPIEIAQ